MREDSLLLVNGGLEVKLFNINSLFTTNNNYYTLLILLPDLILGISLLSSITFNKYTKSLSFSSTNRDKQYILITI